MSVDAYYSSVTLLLRGNGVDGSSTIIDHSATPKQITVNDNTNVSTAQSVFGGASMYFDGTTDYLSLVGSTDFTFDVGDFSVEFWINTADNNCVILDFYSGNSGSWQIYVNSSGRLEWWTTSAIKVGTIPINTGTWKHVAITRYATTMFMFVDGVMDGSGNTDNTNYNHITPIFAVGAQVYSRNPSYDFSGYLDDIRITKGVCRYTVNFTTPDAEFPNSGYSNYTVSGFVYDYANMPASRKIYVHDRTTGDLLGAAISSSIDGSYSISISSPDECYVVCLDDSDGIMENDMIHRAIPS